MCSGQAYVGSALSILKLFAVNVWVMQSALVAELQQRAKLRESFYAQVRN